ncbi:Ubiquitin-binding protein CUE2 [Candida viswanathii]|uniref:Ubiquitin-binding protein CUE2 n=1 Tax=Candida viswanathii TaxID=5486 RepID=A0A367YGK0_9ASCO|nr:Ubiquitin-binding protein CUE2 [Candida viswanathii]
MSLYYDNIIANAGTLPLPKPLPPAASASSTGASLLKGQKKMRKREKLLFCYPLERLEDYSLTRVPHTQRGFHESEIPRLMELRDTDPEMYRSYYYHRDLNRLGTYKFNDRLVVTDRRMAFHVLRAVHELDVPKLFTHGRGKFKFDDAIVCYLSGILNKTCLETLKDLEKKSPAALLQHVEIGLPVEAPTEEEARQIAATMDIAEAQRLCDLLICSTVRFDDCWGVLYYVILITTPQKGNAFAGVRVKLLKNEEEVRVEEDEDVRFNRIMNELHEDMVKLNINPVEGQPDVSTRSKVGNNNRKTTKTTNKKVASPPLAVATSPIEYLHPQQFKVYKLKLPLFLPVSQEFLLDSSDDELLYGGNSNTDTESNCSESELEQEPSDSYSNSQNQFELLTNNGNRNLSQLELVSPTSIEPDVGMTEEEYSEFVYDELDDDPNFIDLVETLTDLFPTYAKTDLKFRLKFADSVEELIEELFIETETEDIREREEELAAVESQRTEPVYDDKVYQLREMFPNIDNATIDRKLRENNSNLEDTTTALLTLPSTEFLSVVSQHKFTANEWNQVSGLVTKITNFLGVNEDTFVLDSSDIVHYVRKSGCNYYDALVGILMNCRPLVMQTVRKQQVGGRVQRGGGGKKGSARPVKTITKLVKSNYRYNPISNEAKELWDLAPSNEQLKSINKTLLINALEFFQGNVYKVIELVSELSSNQTPQHTITAAVQRQQQPVLKFVPKVENDPYILIKNKFKNYATTRSAQHNTTFSASSNEQNRFYQYMESGQVDLHGLRLAEAMKLTKLVLQHWWDEEAKNRELQGHINRFGDKASIGPVKVITGRGIHSANGVSILKRYVREYLKNNKYVFEEEIGSFEVTGKKRR